MASSPYIRAIQLKWDQVPSFDPYPFALDAVRHWSRLELHPKVTYFIGENSSGKSTLLEAIAVSWSFNAEGGTRHLILPPAAPTRRSRWPTRTSRSMPAAQAA